MTPPYATIIYIHQTPDSPSPIILYQLPILKGIEAKWVFPFLGNDQILDDFGPVVRILESLIQIQKGLAVARTGEVEGHVRVHFLVVDGGTVQGGLGHAVPHLVGEEVVGGSGVAGRAGLGGDVDDARLTNGSALLQQRQEFVHDQDDTAHGDVERLDEVRADIGLCVVDALHHPGIVDED